MKITARYPGTCNACRGLINAGELIEWDKRTGATHVQCPDQPSVTDSDAQPDPAFNRARRTQRTMSELLGLFKGVILDGVVSDAEMVALDEWLATHDEAAQQWPADILWRQLRDIFADGVIEPEERSHLKELMEEMVGPVDGARLVDAATRLPLEKPPPTVLFDNHAFCFTGKFVYGPRLRLERAVADRGGMIHSAPKKATNYLVIGTVASRDWAEPSFGRKIEKVVAGRTKGWKCHIVGEEHWVEALNA